MRSSCTSRYMSSVTCSAPCFAWRISCVNRACSSSASRNSFSMRARSARRSASRAAAHQSSSSSSPTSPAMTCARSSMVRSVGFVAGGSSFRLFRLRAPIRLPEESPPPSSSPRPQDPAPRSRDSSRSPRVNHHSSLQPPRPSPSSSSSPRPARPSRGERDRRVHVVLALDLDRVLVVRALVLLVPSTETSTLEKPVTERIHGAAANRVDFGVPPAGGSSALSGRRRRSVTDAGTRARGFSRETASVLRSFRRRRRLPTLRRRRRLLPVRRRLRRRRRADLSPRL